MKKKNYTTENEIKKMIQKKRENTRKELKQKNYFLLRKIQRIVSLFLSFFLFFFLSHLFQDLIQILKFS